MIIHLENALRDIKESYVWIAKLDTQGQEAPMNAAYAHQKLLIQLDL